MRLHPDGVASLIAAIVAEGDVKDLPFTAAAKAEALKRALERRQRQVLEMAREYYKVFPIDFDASRTGWRERAPKNGLQNLARLDRANLHK